MKKEMKLVLIVLVILGGSFWYFNSESPKLLTPLRDGDFLTYQQGIYKKLLKFHSQGAKQFNVTLNGKSIGESGARVDSNLLTPEGNVLELPSLGPLWIPIENVKKGGNAHGDRITEVKQWKAWQVGVVKASFGGGGALRGEWYYDHATGFLVGMKRASVVDPTGSIYTLVETNISGLLTEQKTD